MSIETLIDDIYSLFTDDKVREIDEEALDLLGENIKDSIRKVLKEEKEELQEPTLRMSNIGMKDRKLWYTLHSNPEEIKQSFDAPTRIKFLYGHILEEVLLFLCKQSGHLVEGTQDECSIAGVTGHRDGKIDNVVVDLKKASGFGFKKFQTGAIARGDDPFGYIAQISGYQKADPTSDQDKAGFLVINKENGELCLLLLDKIDLIDPDKRIEEVRNIERVNAPPEQKCFEAVPDGKSGNMVLQRPCAEWCPFRDKCWDNLRFFKYSNGIRVFSKVVKEPNVEEIK
jgi:hypothetical protein